MLRVYVASHCISFSRTKQLVSEIRKNHPRLPVQVINLEDKNVNTPDYVIGTPMYVWEDQVVFLGNPSEADLLDRIGHTIIHD